MDKQATIGFVIIGAILILWLFLNSPKPPEQKPGGKDTTATLVDTTAQSNQAGKEKSKKEKKEENHNIKINKATAEALKDTLDYGKYFSVTQKPGRIITVQNSVVRLELSTKGGAIKKYYLKKYKNWYSAHSSDTANFYKTHVQLINYEKGNEYNLSFVTTDGKAVSTQNLDFDVDANKSDYSVNDGDSLVISFTYHISEDKYIRKTYIFYGDKYSFKSKIDLKGMDNIISNDTYDVVWSNGIRFVEENSVDEARFSNASVYYGGERVDVDASSKGEKKEKNFSGVVDWASVRNKYFGAIIAPDNPSLVNGAYVEGQNHTVGNEGEDEVYNVHLSMPFNNTVDEQKEFTVYIGPVDYNLLKPYGHHFTAMVDFGSFLGLTFLIRPISEYILLPLFNLLHSVIPNYGFVIIVFSLIIKFVLYPFTKSSYQSMKKMQQLQPKIAEMKEKYKDDPQRQQKETMKLYSTYGVNPAGGCLPLLLQMPIFIALYDFLRVAVELRQQPFIFWIKDLSQADVIYHLSFKLPLFGVDQISGLALLMGITTFVQQKMTVKDPKQQGLVYIMPIALTLMFMSFPSGLNLYYFMFNIFSIGQQYFINHKQGEELKPVKNANKKKGFMQRMMEAAEQNAKTQQKKRR
jgi:YidC/Oxa1 family membrane protein insertase